MTQPNVSREYFDQRIEDLWSRVEDRFKAQEERMDEARRVAERVQVQQNEWRGTVTDIMTTMVPRSEYNLAHENLLCRLNDVSSKVNQGEGRSRGMGNVIAWVIAGASAFVAAISLLIDFAH